MALEGVVSGATVSIHGISSQGAGVGELPDGRVVFVDRTAPGDVAEIEVTKEATSWARARLVRLVEEGPDRVEPPCPLYDDCGGCALQHLAYDRQLHWKGRMVVDALERIGGLDEVPDPEVVPSPRELRYRDRLSFTLRRLRGGRVVAGFHHLHRSGHVVDVHDECLLGVEPLKEVWVGLRKAWGGNAQRLPEGGRLRLTLRLVGTDAAGLLVEGGAAGWRGGGLVDEVPGLVDVWHEPSGAAQALRVAGPQGPSDDDGVRPGAFTQVNPVVAPHLRDHVLEQIPEEGDVLDAYCGVGVYGRALAEDGRAVTGIEVDPAACATARRGAPDGFQLREGRVEDLLEDVLPADTVIVNPPRTGLDDRVPGVLLGAEPHRIVYVSCDPATLARDLARLAPTYRLTGLRCFDLFPQTAHIESVAVLEPMDGAGEVAA